jgi:RNA polymerase sigma-70 factor (ECF subfamily)
MSFDDLTDRAVALGRAAWPGVEVDVAALAAFLAPRVNGAAPEDLSWADLFLAHAVLSLNPAALQVFEEQLLRKVEPTLRRLDGTGEGVDDLMQLTRTKLLFGDGRPRLQDYSGRGSLLGWIRAVAVRLALNERKRAPREDANDPDDLPELPLDAEPTLELFRQQHQQDFVVAFREAFARLDPQQRTVLRMSVIDRVSIDRLGAVYGVHRATAARWVERARQQLLDLTRDGLRERLALGDTELSSFLRALVPRLDVSLRTLLGSTSPPP